MEINQQVLKLINQTNQHIFLTGKAGTGKTTLLKQIIESTYKNHIIVAPTGVAAINAGGVTIHSMFQLPFHSFLPTDFYHNENSDVHFETKKSILRHFRVHAIKRNIIQNLDLVIIDEVSMLRPDILDAIDLFLKFVRYSKKPFGGLQLLFIGDLMQLPPIIRQQDWNVLNQFYSSKFFFSAKVLQNEQPLYIELKKIYRQSDQDFIEILQCLRENKVTHEIKEKLEQFIDPDFDIKNNPGYITLTTHNQQADKINQEAIREIKTKEYEYEAEIVDDFPEHSFPIEKLIKLKIGAQVMFIKNDLSNEKRYYNGKIGFVKSLDEDEIEIQFPDEKFSLRAEKHTWENIRYKTNVTTQEVEEEILGTFTQYPLRLAWAITVHKSQGLTFEKCAMDISQVFAPGQAYVALSRLTALSGLKLLSSLKDKNISPEKAIIEYGEHSVSEDILSKNILNYTKDYIYEVFVSCLDIKLIQNIVEKIEKELFDAGDNSTVKKHSKWLKETFIKIEELGSTEQKFKNSMQSYWKDSKDNLDYLDDRMTKAYQYLNEHWKQLINNCLEKQSELWVEKGTKELEKSIDELEKEIFKHLKHLLKAKKLIHLISQNNTINKQSMSIGELEQFKSNIQREITEKTKYDFRSFVEIESRSSKKSKEKKEKKPTHIISYELWKENPSVDKIAEIRKLTKTTIFGHLAKYVEAGAMEIEELMTQERFNSLHKEMEKTGEYDGLSDLKNKLSNQYEFYELRLYLAWKKTIKQ